MIWKDFLSLNSDVNKRLVGTHALLSPSSPSWFRYSEEDIIKRYLNSYATTVGTLVHSYACDLISEKMKLTQRDKKHLVFELRRHNIPMEVIDIDFIFPTVVKYVNDCIKFDMDPEVLLVYSKFCYGTTDAISFDGNTLRISDLKTGRTPASLEQLEAYTALWYLYFAENEGIDLDDINIELRIYQGGDVLIGKPSAENIQPRIDQIMFADNILNHMEK